MYGAVEVQDNLADLVEKKEGWIAPELATVIYQHYLQFAPHSDFWNFYTRKAGVTKTSRGVGSPLTHWHGLEYLTDSSLATAAGDTPNFVAELLNRANQEFGLDANQVQVNLYESGYGLAWHSDKNKKRALKDSKTVTLTINEPGVAKKFAVAPRPLDWEDRKIMQDLDEPMDDIAPIATWTLQTGDCTVYDNQLHEDGVHAVLPSAGTRLGMTFRSIET